MSAPGEAQGPKGATARESNEGDARRLAMRVDTRSPTR
jgi:hypothetical protein